MTELKTITSIIGAVVVGMVVGTAMSDVNAELPIRTPELPYVNMTSWTDPATGAEWFLVDNGSSRLISMFPRVCRDGAPAGRTSTGALFCPDQD